MPSCSVERGEEQGGGRRGLEHIKCGCNTLLELAVLLGAEAPAAPPQDVRRPACPTGCPRHAAALFRRRVGAKCISQASVCMQPRGKRARPPPEVQHRSLRERGERLVRRLHDQFRSRVQRAELRARLGIAAQEREVRAMRLVRHDWDPRGVGGLDLRDAACPLSTRGGTRLVRLVRGRGEGGALTSADRSGTAPK